MIKFQNSNDISLPYGVFMKIWLALLSCFVMSAHAQGTLDEGAFKALSESDHKITLLNQGLASLEKRLQMIEEAKSTIDIEYFIYNNDLSGKIFSQTLIKKAKAGVKIRLLLDYVMIKGSFSPFYAFEMEKNGIEVKYFNTTATLDLFHGQYRNHRKVLLIDGVSAITGGRNIGDEYFDLSDKFNFLDRDLALNGEIVSSIQSTYNELWNSEYSRIVARPSMPESTDTIYRNGNDIVSYEADVRSWKEKVRTAHTFLTVADDVKFQELRVKGKEELASEYQGICHNMNFHSEFPIIGKKNRSLRIIKHEISSRIKNSKESILFDSPYFITDDESSEALEVALANKVKVTLLTNSLKSTDAVYVYDVFDTIIKKWIAKGMDSYIYKGEVPNNYPTINPKIAKSRFGIHAKSFVFDDKDVVIGTFNFDPRSANLNTEMTISCDNNPALAKFVKSDIETRIQGSIHLDSKESVDKAEFYQTGFFKRIAYYILKIPANAFDYLL